MTPTIRKINYLVFALQGLGDTLEATPIVAALKASNPLADVHVAVTRGAPAQLFRTMPELVSNVIELPYWDRGVSAFAAALLQQARRINYAASFMAYPAAKPAYHLVNALFRARRKFGHRYAAPSAPNLLWTYTDLVDVEPKANIERNLDLVAAAGFATAEHRKYAVPQNWLARTPRDAQLVTLHVGSIVHDGFENKRWPLSSFSLVARELHARGYDITLLAGPNELEETAAVLRDVPQARIITGSLDEAARHLAHSAVVITSDSGIGHLAAAVGSPVVGLFGPTPLTGAPYGPVSHPLRPSPCPPCFDPRDSTLSCKLNIDYRCLKVDLPVELVIEQVLTLLRHSTGRRSNGITSQMLES